MRIITIAFLILLSFLQAKILKVPSEYAKVQSAIDASSNSDTVVIYPGTYFENVRFNGKKIVLTSRFYESGDISFITSTIINGSQPSNPDVASCVRIIDNEDSTAILQGLTLTGGKGTAWPDEHSAGTYIEGGGILTAFTAPIIQFNLIINNDAYIGHAGIASAGGGGIRSGDGNPKILNNVIMFNRGFYGAGIVLNYCGGTVRNNLIVGNTGGEAFGGGGIWINGSNSKQKIIENNTILNNKSGLPGGGILGYSGTGTLSVRNNIVWGNIAPTEASISLATASGITVGYNDVQGGFTGTGNINTDPMFADSNLYLLPASSLIDHGDSSDSFNDHNNGTLALFPSLGSKRNDIGAYGGPLSMVLPVPSVPKIIASVQLINFGKIQPDSTVLSSMAIRNIGAAKLKIDSVSISYNTDNSLKLILVPNSQMAIAGVDTIEVQWNPKTIQVLLDTLLVYHNDPSISSPLKIPVTGNAFVIEKAVSGTMYAGSGTTDSAKFYLVDTTTAVLSFKSKTGFSQILSMRIHPQTNELIGLFNSSSPQLRRVSSTTGESFIISSLTIPNPKGMVFGSNGTLLIGSFNGSIYSVNINTGIATVLFSTGIKIAGLAFNPIDGTLWASVRPTSSGKDNIYTINMSTGAPTLVGNTGFGITTKDITFNGKGELFGVIDTTGSQSYLIHIDQTTGKGTVIGGMSAKGIETIELSSYYITGVEIREQAGPSKFLLEQNYPNPFNPSTKITYQLQKQAFIKLFLYDALGREVAELVNRQQEAGYYTVELRSSEYGLASGVYFYKLNAGSFTSVKKMILMK